MIFVDRSKVARPAVLDKVDKKGKTETQRAIEYFTSLTPKADPFKFKIYSDPEVKQALITLFHNKCAYCESSFLHVYPGDVEHFRPKLSIEEPEQKKPGYYWLAADWDNLLLSCRDCNQKLSHSIFGSNVKKTMGKMSQFPLTNLKKYVRKHNHKKGIQAEEDYRLLLNPCIDQPEEHLEYGEQGVIKPKKDKHGVPSKKGEKSIDVYVLQRVYLVQAREKKLIEIRLQIQRVKEAVANCNNYPDREEFETTLNSELIQLKNYTSIDSPYSAMARQVIGEFMRVNFGVKV